ncbi:WD40 repeat-like protein, partial [Schizopora paradoxa]
DDNEEWSALLDAITNSTEFPQTFKLVVTSRDFPDIRSALSGISHELAISTGTDASAESKSDIEVFFRSKLAGSPRASYWLSGDILPQLVDRAAGSFIWAKMFAGLVELNAHGRLEDIDIATGDTPGSTENVDVLYAKVLVETFGQLPEKERDSSRILLSTLVLAEDPLHRETLESLPFNGLYRNQAHQSAKTILDGLSSIITVDKNLRVRIPHKSFSDFYLSRSRCQKAMEQLNLPTKEQHAYLMREQDDQGNLAIACLQWMCNTLTFNTYGISSSHVLNSKIPQLEDEDHTLVYACRYWGEHLKHTTRDNSFCAQAQLLLRIFFHQKVLFWLEILSLAKAVTSAEKSLMATAREFLEGYDDDLAAFADDVLEFVTDFKYPITEAASHIYISALPFSPSNSRIFQVYAPQFPNLFSVTSGRREDWGDAPVTGNGHDSVVQSVCFFQDGSRLASASWDKTVRIWDSETGNATSPPFKHDSSVYCMAVSPDRQLIASGDENGALSIWDRETGARKLNLTGAHNYVIWSVAFSPDGSRFVTGSNDNTVKVWDTASGELCIGPLTGHTGHVNSVVFSPDGTLIASGSFDKTIQIWDSTSDKSHVESLVGHTSSVFCLAFTADGQFVASGSSDKTIRLWNAIHGFTQTSIIQSGSVVHSISFSPKSEILASGHKDGSLHFWDLRAGELHQLCNPIHGHTNEVMSIAFSPDGLLLASGSDDKSTKIWTMPTSTT